jgi:hypothetical protein
MADRCPRQNPFGVSAFMHGLAKLIFRVTGWKIEGGVPSQRASSSSQRPTSGKDAFIMLTQRTSTG